jgi:ribosomal protein S18 acetylase RimI-like enzyme
MTEMLPPISIEIVSAANIVPKDVGGFLDAVVDVEARAWPPELRASRAKFESRLKIFPKGFTALNVDGKIQAVTTSQRCNYDPTDSGHHTWDEFTDSGMIEKTHTPTGNALYVVSVGVASDAQGMGLGGELVKQQKKIARELGVEYLFLGARAPGYDAYIKEHGEISMEDYLIKTNEKGESVDPEIRFYQRQGLRPARVIPDFEPDTQSHDYGVVMVWEVSSK